MGRRIAVVFPPNNQHLSPRLAAQLIKAQYWGLYPRPEKIVVLVDADSSDPREIENQMRGTLQPLVADLETRGLSILVAAAKWQLEAWFFADPTHLREFLGRDLGSVDLSDPDAIPSPKQRLRDLLRRLYTAKVSGDIARVLSPQAIRLASKTFASFEAAIENGGGHAAKL
jgi:hypothetical protein